MKSLTRRPAHVCRLGTAALLAATAVLGTTSSTLADPATACAEPKKPGFDRDGYLGCLDAVSGQLRRGEITYETWEQKAQNCCVGYGGEARFREDGGFLGCADTARDPASLPHEPFPTEATQPPPSPTFTMAPLPSTPPIQTR